MPGDIWAVRIFAYDHSVFIRARMRVRRRRGDACMGQREMEITSKSLDPAKAPGGLAEIATMIPSSRN